MFEIDTAVTAAIFLIGQTGLAIWKFSSLETRTKANEKAIEKFEAHNIPQQLAVLADQNRRIEGQLEYIVRKLDGRN